MKILKMKKSCRGAKTIQRYGQKYGTWTLIQKCKHMRHGVKTPLQPYTMKSDQERVSLEQVNPENDLGVIFDKLCCSSMNICI